MLINIICIRNTDKRTNENNDYNSRTENKPSWQDVQTWPVKTLVRLWKPIDRVQNSAAVMVGQRTRRVREWTPRGPRRLRRITTAATLVEVAVVVVDPGASHLMPTLLSIYSINIPIWISPLLNVYLLFISSVNVNRHWYYYCGVWCMCVSGFTYFIVILYKL